MGSAGRRSWALGQRELGSRVGLAPQTVARAVLVPGLHRPGRQARRSEARGAVAARMGTPAEFRAVLREIEGWLFRHFLHFGGMSAVMDTSTKERGRK